MKKSILLFLLFFSLPIALAKKDKTMTLPVRHITVSINSSAEEVYEFNSNPINWTKWASGLSTTIKKVGESWEADSPMGKVKIRFSSKNDFGILDHDVTIPSGKTFHNPLRVIRNNEGSEVVFTLFRQPEMSDEEFERDAETVAKDLRQLKKIMERH